MKLAKVEVEGIVGRFLVYADVSPLVDYQIRLQGLVVLRYFHVCAALVLILVADVEAV